MAIPTFDLLHLRKLNDLNVLVHVPSILLYYPHDLDRMGHKWCIPFLQRKTSTRSNFQNSKRGHGGIRLFLFFLKE